MNEEQRAHRGEAWMRSLEGIHYRIAYLGESEFTRAHIANAVSRLPGDVQDFACERCRFVSVGEGAMGITLPGSIGVNAHEKRSRNMWIIVLDDRIPVEELDGVVAHEIAHAWLGHNRCEEVTVDDEVAAATLTREWGFTGRGADPEAARLAG